MTVYKDLIKMETLAGKPTYVDITDGVRDAVRRVSPSLSRATRHARYSRKNTTMITRRTETPSFRRISRTA